MAFAGETALKQREGRIIADSDFDLTGRPRLTVGENRADVRVWTHVPKAVKTRNRALPKGFIFLAG
jgi:hypothetical protein